MTAGEAGVEGKNAGRGGTATRASVQGPAQLCLPVPGALSICEMKGHCPLVLPTGGQAAGETRESPGILSRGSQDSNVHSPLYPTLVTIRKQLGLTRVGSLLTLPST